MRARHTAHSTPTFPVYSAAFLSPSELVLGGGGGASKTGIKNKLVRHHHLSSLTPIPHFLLFFQRLYHVDEFLTLKFTDELQLETGEDAPMSMAVCPDVLPFCRVRQVQLHTDALIADIFLCMWNQQLCGNGRERREPELPGVHDKRRRQVSSLYDSLVP